MTHTEPANPEGRVCYSGECAEPCQSYQHRLRAERDAARVDAEREQQKHRALLRQVDTLRAKIAAALAVKVDCAHGDHAINGLSDVRRTLRAALAGAVPGSPPDCPKCGASGDEPCITSGNLPVGELPGDPYLGKDNRPAWHRQRRAAVFPGSPETRQEEQR